MSCLSCAILMRNIIDFRENSFANIMTGRIIDIDNNYIYVKSQRTKFLIEKNSVNFKLTIGSEVQFQTDRTRAPILIKKYCFYKRYYICKILS